MIPTSRALIFRELHTSQARYSDQLPTVFSREFWANLVPRPFRGSAAPTKPKAKSKEWNPATFFIIMFLFIGSMSINQIIVQTEYQAFMERADAKISVLREVVEKLQKGEDVDVEKTLGTGDAAKEQDWKDRTSAQSSPDIPAHHGANVHGIFSAGESPRRGWHTKLSKEETGQAS